MPDPIPFRGRPQPTSTELTEVVAAFAGLDPDDDEQWRAVFTEFDHRLPSDRRAWVGIAAEHLDHARQAVALVAAGLAGS